MNQTMILTFTELKLLVRNRTALVNAVLLPLALGAFLIYRGAELLGGAVDGWVVVICLQSLLTLGFTVYLGATNSLTARRQDLYLKRLRSGEASDRTILGGILLPTALLGVLQLGILFAASVIAGAPLPAHPELVLLGLLGGIGLSVVFAALTSGLTATAELTQVTTLPFVAALVGSAMWVLLTPAREVSTLMLATPAGGLASLVRQGFSDTAAFADAVPAIGLLAAWVFVGGILAGRLFRWEPRG